MALTPSLGSVSPNPVPADTNNHAIKVLGSSFQSGDTLTFTDPQGNVFANRVPTFVSATELDYSFNDGNDPGNWTVKVNSPDGTLHSGAVSFSVATAQLTPSVSSVSPSPIPADTSDHAIKVLGSSFQSGDTLTFTDPQGNVFANRVPSFVSSGELDYSFNDGNDPGNWTVKVNSPDGTLHSGSTSFSVATAQLTPSVSSVSPSPIPADTSDHAIKVLGSSFQSGDTLTFTDPQGNVFANRVPSFVSSGELDYSFNDGNDPGNWTVKVNSPDGTLHSGATSFVVGTTQLTPSVSSVSPSPIPADTSDHAIKVLGSSFRSGDTLTFTDPQGNVFANRVPTFVSSSELDYSFNDGNDPGNWTVKVNSPDGALHSGATSFSVGTTQLTPSVSSVSPSPIPADTSDHAIKVLGSSFQSGDTLTFTDPQGNVFANRVPTFVSSGELDYSFNDGNDPGTWTVKVNSPDGALHSGATSFTVATTATTDQVLDNVNTLGVLTATVAGTIDSEPMSGSTTNISDGAGGLVDKDWFKVTLNKGNLYTFSGAATSMTTGLMDINLYGQNGTSVILNAVEGATPSFTFDTTHQTNATQTYYLAVSAGGADPAWKTATGNYSVSLSGQAATAAPDHIPGSIQGAFQLPENTTHFDTIDSSDVGGGADDDYYQVTLNGGSNYVFTASAGVSDTDTLDSIFIRLRDSSGNILSTSSTSDAGPGPSFHFTAPGTGAQTYFLAISASGVGSSNGIPTDQKTGSYSVSFVDPAPAGAVSAPTSGNGETLTSSGPIEAGFDTEVYPGDAVMASLSPSQHNTNLHWVGYYLDAPSQRTDTGWLGTRSYLESLGWKIAPIYVGQQDPNFGGNNSFVSQTNPAEQGVADAKEAIAEMGPDTGATQIVFKNHIPQAPVAVGQGFAAGTVVYLDWENAPFPTMDNPNYASDVAYIVAWCKTVSENGTYNPGIYCKSSDISAIAPLVSDYNVQFWDATWDSKTPKTVSVSSTQTQFLNSIPPGGVKDAAAWQYGAGYNAANGLLTGVDLDAFRVSSAATVSVDSPQAAAVSGNGGLVAVQGSGSNAGTNVAVGANGTSGVVSDGITGDIKAIFNGAKQFLFNGGLYNDVVKILHLISEGISNDTVFFNGNDGDDTLDGTGADTTIVASGGSGNDILVGGPLNDVLNGGPGNNKLDGGPGTDTVDYSGAPGAVTVNLTTGSAANGFGGTDTLSNIESIIGSAFNDSLTGDPGNDTLTGGPGNDRLIGGAGNDIAMYSAAVGTYTLLAYNGTLAVLTHGADGDDRLQGIETLQFSDTAYAASAAAAFDPWEYIASYGDLIGAIGANPQAGFDHYVDSGFGEGRATNLFDAVEYIASNPDLIQAFGLNPLAGEQHYVTSGFNEHRATNSFDATEYIASNPDLIQAFGLNPLAGEQHYITSGFKEHRATNLFDPVEYIASNADLIQALGLNSLAGEQQYIVNGFKEHRPTNSFDAVEYIASNTDLIAAFGLNALAGETHYIVNGFNEHRATASFDPIEYIASNADLITAFGFNGLAGEQHYVVNGFKEHRPTTSFDATEYIASNTDLIAAFGLNPLAGEKHYITSGFKDHRPTTSFDATEYIASNVDLIQAYGLNLLAGEQHYVGSGFNEHRPTSSFDAIEYIASNTDLITAFGLNPLGGEQHYIVNGFKEHRPTNSFDATEYIASNTDLITAFGLNGLAGQQHYIVNGFKEHRPTSSFDATEYLASNTDLIQAFGLNPLAGEKHYITNGFSEHRLTNSFDAIEYIASNPDLITTYGFNPLAGEQHYVGSGFNEHRATSSFDALEYLASNADLIQAFGLNLAVGRQHYIVNGFNEHRPTASFDAIEYIASNPDLIQAFGVNAVAGEQHYVVNGFGEHRATSSFDAAQYLANYADLSAAFGNDLAAAEGHYITNGFSEGRTDKAPVVTGDSGNNTLVAKNGAIMTGGGGADNFVFNAPLTKPATINDFAAGTDHLQISASGFGHGLVAGGTAPLVSAATAAGASHPGPDGYFIFDNAGTVWWDPNGGGGADAVALAKLASVAALHASDFLLA